MYIYIYIILYILSYIIYGFKLYIYKIKKYTALKIKILFVLVN